MKKGTIIGCALGLLVAASGPANAAILLDSWDFNLSGVDGLAAGTGATGVKQITYFGESHAQNLTGNPGVGGQSVTDGVFAATNFTNTLGQQFGGTVGLNSSYEMTFVYSVGTVNVAQQFSAGVTTNSFNHLDGGTTINGYTIPGILNVYVDNLANNTTGNDVQAQQTTGLGYTNGTLVGVFAIAPSALGDGGTFRFEPQDGSDDATFTMLWGMSGVFMKNGQDISTNPSQALFAVTDNNFDANPDNVDSAFPLSSPSSWNTISLYDKDGNVIYTFSLAATGSPLGFFALEDGSARLGVAAVPEPSTIFLLGGGLIGLGIFGRKRRIHG